jgi:UDP-N-acetylmuramate--alanine ligase
MSSNEVKKIFCIGIGGIGLSALARYYKSQGYVVGGSDSNDSELTTSLSDEGINVVIGTDKNHISNDLDLVVYTAALKDNHPELVQAREFGIRAITYFEALGEVTKNKKTIAVSGTHGKTTTTAMTYYALKACGINPTVIVGSLLTEHNSNFILGDGEWMVVEACEYKRSFLSLHPSHIIVTNIDSDHLDYYKDIDDIKSAFQSFAEKLNDESFLVTHNDVTLESKANPTSLVSYDGARPTSPKGSGGARKINADDVDVNGIQLNVLGEHNKRNAQLVIALLTNLGFPEDKIREGLLNFKGTWRRMEYKGEQKGAIMYDDYGHHPTEIKATLQALREKYKSGKFKLVAVFQPHLYSRTKLLLDDFAGAFTLADKICVLPIYAAREKDDGSISSHDLVEKTDNAIYMENLEEVKKYIDKNCHSGSVVVTIGAGDVYKLHGLFESR